LKDKSIFDFIEPDVLDNFKTNWDNIVKGVSFEGQYLFRTKYNEEKWYRTFFSPVFDMYNDVNKIVQISQDITKEKIMEIETKKQNEQLKIQEEKLLSSGVELTKKLELAKLEMKKQYEETERIKIRNEKTLEGALDAILTIDQRGFIAFFNKAAEELWGYDRSEVLNHNVSMLFSSNNIQENQFINAFVQISSKKVIGKREEVKITDKKGEDHSVLFLVSEAIVDNEHTFTAFIQQIEVELF
jgi:PAS domain S-box-containing protein